MQGKDKAGESEKKMNHNAVATENKGNPTCSYEPGRVILELSKIETRGLSLGFPASVQCLPFIIS